MVKKILLVCFVVLFAFGETFNDFYKKFIVNDSYTIDPYNNNRVTTEAQGYTLYLCVKYNKKQLFDSIFEWTKRHLQREDNLFSWVYNDNRVLDRNNATDGDLFIAYSLLLAYKKWRNVKYLEEFRKIFRSVTNLFLPIVWDYKLDMLLFPAKYGFLKNNTLTIFPSYYIPFIFKAFSKYNALYKKAYDYAYSIFFSPNLTTHIYYNLIGKQFSRGSYTDLDVYRIIWYSYLDNKDVSLLQDTFAESNHFFKKHGFIPLKLYTNGNYEGKSPYCVYRWFYLVYKNKKYLNMYYSLKKLDKKNYFCSALELMEGEQ